MNEQTNNNPPEHASTQPPPVPVSSAGHAAQEAGAPPIYRAEGRASRGDGDKKGMAERFAKYFGPMEKQPSLMGTIDALLKRPARVAYEVTKGGLGQIRAVLVVIIVVCMAAYGLVMGSFSGGHQLWLVPVKVVTGIFLSGLICLPSLYILTALSGADHSFAQVCGLFLQALALSALLLVGFAPISWIFSQATDTVAFMGGLHIVFWVVGICFSMRLLKTAFSFLNKRRIGIITFWGIIFVAVVMQMTTTLRPLVGESRGFGIGDKKFFLAHWGESLD